MEETLKYIYANIIDAVKFAEAKNGVLIGFLGAGIIGFLTGFSGAENEFLSKVILGSAVPFFGLAILLVFLSFMPVLDTVVLQPKVLKETHSEEGKEVEKLEINPIIEKLKKSQPISLFYFESLKKLEPKLLLGHLYQAYQKEIPLSFPPIEIDLAYQIVVNSVIASAKFKAFKMAGYLTLIGIVLPVLIYLVGGIMG